MGVAVGSKDWLPRPSERSDDVGELTVGGREADQARRGPDPVSRLESRQDTGGTDLVGDSPDQERGLSQAERDFRASVREQQRLDVSPLRREGDQIVHAVYLVKAADEPIALYKPRSGEFYSLHRTIPDVDVFHRDEGRGEHRVAVPDPRAMPEDHEPDLRPFPGAAMKTSIPEGWMAFREVAAYRFDEDVGWDLVPVTTWCDDGPWGPGSLQKWVHGVRRGLSPAEAEYSCEQRWGLLLDRYGRPNAERAGVTHYHTAALDGHGANFGTRPQTDSAGDRGTIPQRGRPVLFDNGLCFPESATDPIRSDFVAGIFNEPLSEQVIMEIGAVELDRRYDRMRDSGLSAAAADGAMDRLIEVQRDGKISGEAWPGPIVHADWTVVREPR